MKDTVSRWSYTRKFATLSSEFGLELACKKFNMTAEEIEKLVGRYTKGKNIGQLRGSIEWLKVDKGGWVKTGAYDWDAMRANGFVAKPGVCFAFQLVNWDKLILDHPDTRPGKRREETDTDIDVVNSYWATRQAKENKFKQGEVFSAKQSGDST